ncbi:putative membrane protein [Geobacillus kaustophilus]|uniref:Putative membrane protein n=1 Tax=Geobacillus kaustophilus TaxID=1462 RepID=A0A0D8BWM1_GEOKU|nr:hypothetical protein [Geobacillus kaustophilus]KJE27757.1 putative membrane protein [Geobacillus kaustophilus]
MDKKTIAHHFSFDRRLLGRLYWFPFLVYGLCVGLMGILSARSDEPFLPYTVIQGMAVPIAGWHLVFLYRHLYDEGAKEALLWHYRKAVVFDLVRYAVLHGGCIVLLVAAVIWIHGTMFLTAPVLVHLFLLFSFYQLIGLALLGVFGSLDVALSVISVYTFMEVVTQGTFMPWPHLFLFQAPADSLSLLLPMMWLGAGIVIAAILIGREFW